MIDVFGTIWVLCLLLSATPKGLLEVLLGRDMDEEAEQMSSLNAYSPVSGSAGLLSRAFALLVISLDTFEKENTHTFAMLQHGLLFSIAFAHDPQVVGFYGLHNNPCYEISQHARVFAIANVTVTLSRARIV